METTLTIDIASLDSAHRSAFEDVIGVPLRVNQQLVVRVIEAEPSKQTNATRPGQTLDDLPNIFEGLSDEQIEVLDRDIKTRVNLTRNLP
jgi:hypothetical protein